MRLVPRHFLHLLEGQRMSVSFPRTHSQDYLAAKIMNYFNNKFPRTFHSIATERDNYNLNLYIRFRNGRTVKVDDTSQYERPEVLARCIMVHSLTDALP